MKDVLASQYFNSKNNSGNDSLDSHRDDTLEIEIYQPWLELYDEKEQKEEKEKDCSTHLHLEHNHDHHNRDHHSSDHHSHDHHSNEHHSHEHDHDGPSHGHGHDHGHEHEGRIELENRAVVLEGSSEASPGIIQECQARDKLFCSFPKYRNLFIWSREQPCSTPVFQTTVLTQLSSTLFQSPLLPVQLHHEVYQPKPSKPRRQNCRKQHRRTILG